MKKLILSLFAIVMMGSFSNRVVAQTSATTSDATATATIIAPITISHSGTDMNFGNVIKGAGTVVLLPAGTRSVTGDTKLPGAGGAGTVTAAVFTVGGEGSYTYSITLPSSAYTITETGGDDMTVTTFTSTPSGTGTLSSGSQTLNVGATLNVSADQASGVYENSTGFDVTVAYN